MTNITDLYGPDALNTHDFIGWLKTDEGIDFVSSTLDGCIKRGMLYDSMKVNIIDDQHTHNSQPMNKEMFVPREKPKRDDYDYESYQYALKAYENHQPLFAGEWKVDKDLPNSHDEYVFYRESKVDHWVRVCPTWDLREMDLNKFLTENPGLKWNTKFELK